MTKLYLLKSIAVLFFVLCTSLAFAHGPVVTAFNTDPAGTQISASLCGTVLPDMDGEIYADQLRGATAYRFRITQGSNVQEIESADNTMRLSAVSFYAYNTTYSIDVDVQLGRGWLGYGSACNVTSAAPVTQLAAAICGTVLTGIEGDIYADNVPTATAYRFKITQGSNVQVVESADGTMRLKDINFYAYNTTYSVEVAPNVGGTWAAYGAACNVTTMAPVTQVVSWLCGTVLPDLEGEIYSDGVPTATAFRFRVTRGSDVQVLESAESSVRLSDLSFYAYSTTYSVEVAANVGGTWAVYGAACNVTTAAATTQLGADICGTVLTSIEGDIYADNVPRATAYRFKVTQGSNVQVVESADGTMRLKDINFYAYNTVYKVEVAANAGGTWIAYGAACNVTTAAPTTKLAVDICGAVLPSIDGEIYSDGVPTATAFRFRVTQGSNVQVLESAETTVRLIDLTFYAYNTTYSVEVAANVGGTWTAYGTACNVTTAAPTTQVRADICGTVLSGIEGEIFADGVPTATAYRFRVTRGSNVQVLESAENSVRLKDLTFYAYNTTFSVEVAANVGGTWAAYGTACNVTTAAPTTQVRADICGTVLSDIEGEIFADGVPTATAYRFRVTRGSNVQVLESAENSVRLKDLTFYAYNTTYSIQVAANVGGTWAAYGAACHVTTAQVSTLTITANTQTKVYGSANPALTYTYTGFVNGDTPENLSSPPIISTAAVTGSPVSNYPITISGAVAPGYNIVFVPAVLTVTPAPLTLTADNKAVLFGAAIPALTVKYTGFVNGDTQTDLITLPITTTTATASSRPGNYAITASGAQSNNYNITYAPGVLTVTPLSTAAINSFTISTGALSPAFSSSTFAYTAAVGYDVDNLAITATYDATATATVNGTRIQSGRSNRVALNAGSNTITMVITAQDGTTKNTYTIAVYRAIPPNAIVPTNILTPNGDGKNDTWIIKDIELYPNNVVTIYDKAGRAVYTKKGYTNDWDGTLKGAPLTQGTYYYTINFGPGMWTVKGFITILKSR